MTNLNNYREREQKIFHFEEVMYNNNYYQNTGECQALYTLGLEDAEEVCCPNCPAKDCCIFKEVM